MTETEQYDGGEEPACGDIISRAGKDRWVVEEWDGWQLASRCVKGSSWCRIGDRECLTPAHYSLIERKALGGE